MKKNILILITFITIGSILFLIITTLYKNSIEVKQEIHELGLNKYQEITANCSGTYLFDLKIGEKINLNEIPNANCQSENVYSKINGYSCHDSIVEIYVNVLKVKENKVFNLNDKYIGEYIESNLNEYYPSGSVLNYTFSCSNTCTLESISYQS